MRRLADSLIATELAAILGVLLGEHGVNVYARKRRVVRHGGRQGGVAAVVRRGARLGRFRATGLEFGLSGHTKVQHELPKEPRDGGRHLLKNREPFFPLS